MVDDNLMNMIDACMFNPIGMTDRRVAESYWEYKQQHDTRIALLNLLLNT